MKKTTLALLLSLGSFVAFGAEPNIAQALETGKNLCQILETSKPTVEETGRMIDFCMDFANSFVNEARRIKTLPTKEERKLAADRYNRSMIDVYNLYNYMFKYLRQQCRDSMLTDTQTVEVEKLIADNAYINRMFTKFRSGHDL